MDSNMTPLSAAIRQFRLPRFSELPDVGLYLEQTTKYINSFLAPLGCLEITASMISNYVKKGLIPKPNKKQYSAEHLAYLFFVAIAKQLVSMENITVLIQMQQESYALPVAYDYFCDELENVVFFLFGIQDIMDDLGQTVSEEKELLRGLLFSAGHVIYLRARLDAYCEKKAAALLP